MTETTWKLLHELVARLEYRPGWSVSLKHDQSTDVLTLEILAKGYNAYHPERGDTYRVIHSFIVPPATYNEQSWTRWLLDRFIDVETHEVCEFFKLTKPDVGNVYDETATLGFERPFAPNHGPGWNPYVVRELNRVEDAETTFRGERREGTQSASAIIDDPDAPWGAGANARP